MSTHDSTEKKWWQPLVEFCTHVLVGTGIFIIIALPAIGISFAVAWLEKNNMDTVIVTGLYLAEYTLFVLDVALFLVFLVRAAWRAFKEL